MKINSILVAPVLTEKATSAAQKKVYTFEVAKRSDKNQIRYSVEKLFGVKVSGIRIVIRKGKIKRVGKKMTSKKSEDKKFAQITVKEGGISLFPQA
jgi:large subunit ribosomal protein L23